MSLRSDDGYEWLASSTAPSGIVGESFTRAGMGGWDEVAPSVQADAAPHSHSAVAAGAQTDPAAGVPDHGDIWNVPWTVKSATASALIMEVRLRSVPVTLRRTISATAAGLRLSYRATSESADPVSLLWCAHPQFAGAAGATLKLEAGGAAVSPTLIEVHPIAGRTRVFPTPPLHESLPAGGSLKAFVGPDSLVDAAVLTVAGGRSLRLSWDSAELPYLGLYWDNGECASTPVLAIEPSTGWGDLLSEATRLGRVRTVSAAAPLEWSLELSA